MKTFIISAIATGAIFAIASGYQSRPGGQESKSFHSISISGLSIKHLGQFYGKNLSAYTIEVFGEKNGNLIFQSTSNKPGICPSGSFLLIDTKGNVRSPTKKELLDIKK